MAKNRLLSRFELSSGRTIHAALSLHTSPFILPLLLIGCLAPSRSASAQSTQPDAMTQRVVEANNRFGFEVYQKLAADRAAPDKKATGKNLLFSPYSISTTLSILLEGARGETAKQLHSVLQFPIGTESTAMTNPQALADGIQSLRKQITGSTADQPFLLFPANGIWIDQSFSVLPAFLSSLKETYGIQNPFAVNFKNVTQSQQTINAWGDQATKGKIKQILPVAPSPQTAMVLASAVYMKGAWFKPFDQKATAPKPFHLDGNPAHDVIVPMMSQIIDDNLYFENDDFQMTVLMYGYWQTNADQMKAVVPACMVLVLPKRIDALAAVEQSLTWEALDHDSDHLAKLQVQIELPKVNFDDSLDLMRLIGELGATDLSDPHKADFSGIAPSAAMPLYVSSATHAAAIDVNEEGTEAAAASTADMAMGGAPPKRVEFRADHPFLFYIIHTQTNAILFMGRVMNPRD